MWNQREGEGHDEQPRVSTNSEVVIMDRPIATISGTVPAVSNLNVTKSSKVHIGPKFVSVTQNVSNKEVVKGRIFGLELESSKRARRIRCSVAVFVCWAFLVATGLATYLIYVAIPGQPTRLDIDLPLPKYVWEIVKNSSRTERLSCAAALIILIVCISLIVYFTILAAQATEIIDRGDDDSDPECYPPETFTPELLKDQICSSTPFGMRLLKDITQLANQKLAGKVDPKTYARMRGKYLCFMKKDAPHEWRISRNMWLAQNYSHDVIAEEFEPLMLVVVQHSVSNECSRFILCAAELRNLQAWFIKFNQYDIPYNFIIGNDGRVYDGCGWGLVGAHTFGYNRCSVGIGFIGDYREEITHHTRVTEAQLNRTLMLLEEGVRLGYLRPDYKVVGAKDLRPTASPGSNLYNAIRQWDHFDHENLFANMTCEQMHEKYPYTTG